MYVSLQGYQSSSKICSQLSVQSWIYSDQYITLHRNVKNIQKMNERMLEMGVEDSQAWHKQYKDSAYVFIGNVD